MADSRLAPKRPRHCLGSSSGSNGNVINYMAVGNPGNGKSTFLNALIGEVKFKSGFKAGTGMTFQFDKHQHGGNWYFDTPGLSDTEKRRAAGEAIEQALKSGGRYKIIFVVFLQSGRVLPQDVQTMITVLKACPSIGNQYGVIINKAPKLDKVEADLDLIKASLFATFKEKGIQISAFVTAWPLDNNLSDEDNKLAALPEHIKTFVDVLPTVVIRPDDVKPLELENFDENSEHLQKMVDDLVANNAAMQQMMSEQQATMRAQMSDMMKAMQAANTAATNAATAAANAARGGGGEAAAGIGTKILRTIPILGALF